MRSYATARDLLVVAALTLASAEAVASGIDDFRSGCADTVNTTSNSTTVNLFTVPQSARFVLTDLSWARSQIGSFTSGTANLLTIGTPTQTRWRSPNTGSSSAVNPPTRTWATGLVFQPGDVVQLTVSQNGIESSQWSACWSGYLAPLATSSIAPGGRDRPLQLGVLPNPSSAPATLSFSLPRRSQVVIGIFDILGRRVRTLYRGQMEAGAHELAWDGLDDHGSASADGVYMAQLEYEHVARTSKIVRAH